jgi:hypothetical protein
MKSWNFIAVIKIFLVTVLFSLASCTNAPDEEVSEKRNGRKNQPSLSILGV